MIAKLIFALQEAQLNMTAEEIADALWLSRYLDETPLSLSGTSRSATARPIEASQVEQEQSTDNIVLERNNELIENLHLLSEHSTDRSGLAQYGDPFRSPTASALPRSLGIARALRPLMRRIPSHKAFTLDEQATAQRIAEEGIWHPVLKPSPTRWFDVALVIDESTSMRIWSQTIAAFQYLLEHLGAFRDVRLWRLITDKSSNLVLYEGKNVSQPFQLPHSPQELLDPSGCRLILIITDCVSPPWYSGVAQQTVAAWSNHSTVSIIQVLPQRLWWRTALRYATPVLLRSSSPNISNTQLKVQMLLPWLIEKPAKGLQIPVMTLEPRLLANWARMIRGEGNVWSPGFIFDSYEQEEAMKASKLFPSAIPQQEPTTAQERVRRFRASASPLAQKLAELLATAPVSLPVIRLIQQTMLPESRQTHVAEVFLGGLLEEKDQEDENLALDYIEYEFIADVRDLLLNSVSSHEALHVIKEISRFIANRYGQSPDFLTLLSDPSSPRGLAIDRASLPFARIAAGILRRIGGRYIPQAEQLEKACMEQSSTGSIRVQEIMSYSLKNGKKVSRKDSKRVSAHKRFATRDITKWLELRRRNNQQTILLLGSRAGALYRSLPFYEYCQQYTTHHLQTHARMWSFRECYNVLLQQQLGERELHALLQAAFRHVVNLLDEEDECFAEIVKRGYFREIITTNIDDLVERALIRVGLVEGEDFAVLIPSELPLSRKRALPYRLTKVFGDFLSRKYIVANRHSYITDHDEFQQYLRGILHGGVLAIGIDPLWDSAILPLLYDAPATLWFLNEDEDIAHDRQIAPILDQAESVVALGQNYSNGEFWRSLYQQLGMARVQDDETIQESYSSIIKQDGLIQYNKKVIRVFYMYCDDDLSMMQNFWRHLQLLRSHHLITEWHRGLLEPGEHLHLKQERELRSAQLIIIGFSSSFIVSEYYEQALQSLELSHGESVTLIPLLLCPVDNWKQTPFSAIAPLPREGKKTLSELTSKDVDKELTKIADDIHKLVKRLQKGKD